MPLGTEVGLGPGDFVLDGAQLPPQTKGTPPIFGPCLLWGNGCPSQLLLELLSILLKNKMTVDARIFASKQVCLVQFSSVHAM